MVHLPRALLYISAILVCSSAGCTVGGSDGDDGGGGSSGGSSSSSQCSNTGSGNLGVDRKADMQVTKDGQIVQSKSKLKVAAGGQTAGGVIDTRLDIINAASLGSARELLIKQVFLTYTPPATGKDGPKPAFECFLDFGDGNLVACKDHPPRSVVPSGGDDICTTAEKGSKLSVIARFNKPADDIERQAFLRLVTEGDDKFDGANGFQAMLTSKVGLPVLQTKSIIDFGTVKLNETGEQILTVANTGEADLQIQQIKLAPSDPKPYALEFDGADGSKVAMKGGETKTFDNLIIEPQATMQLLAKFSALDGNGHEDIIEIVANDNKKNHQIKMIANQQVACLTVTPSKAVNFGFVPIGHSGKRPVVLSSCGSDKVVISDLKLKNDKDQVFKILTDKVTKLGGKPISKDNPLTLTINESVTVEVECTPESAAEKVEPGKAQYTAAMAIDDNTVQPNKNISLLCNGTKTNCPTSVIVPQEGEEIVPQQELHLVGSQSFAGPSQELAKYQWEVTKRPKGSEDHVFWPNPNSPDVLFGAKTPVEDLAGNLKTCNTSADCAKGHFCQDAPGGKTQKICYTAKVNIAGEFGFKLTVWDKAGNKNCADAKQTVLVIPNEAIHVELLWDTPGDQDKFDKGLDAGSDMDLHFSHQSAAAAMVCTKPPKMCGSKPCKCQQDLDADGKADPWFHSPFDTYWFNPSPNWGSADPSIDDNPGLDLDDTDGWGPENMNLNNPQNNHVYSVGVHYWDAHGFGDSVANVRIYILGKLVADMFSVTMKQCDFWWVKQIDWPSGQLIDYADKAGKKLPNGKISAKYFTQFAATLGAKCSGK